MDLQVPVILLLLAANVLWFIVGWGKGFEEGKREGLAIGKNQQKLPKPKLPQGHQAVNTEYAR